MWAINGLKPADTAAAPVPETSKAKVPTRAPDIAERELAEILVDFARTTTSHARKKGRIMESERSELEILEDLKYGNSRRGGSGNRDSVDGLMILATSLAPINAPELTDAELVSRLRELIQQADIDPKVVSKWTVSRGRVGSGPVYVTEKGVRLNSNVMVAQSLQFDDVHVKLAELMDYMDARQVPISPRDWRVEERRKADGKRTGFSFVYSANGLKRTFYARNKAAEFIAQLLDLPLPEILERGGGDAPAKKRRSVDGDAEQPTTGSKKKRRSWKPYDTVDVDYEGKLYEGIIVPTPLGEPKVDSDNHRLLSVFYTKEESFEHGVLESRVARERQEKKKDQRLISLLRSGELRVDVSDARKNRRRGAKMESDNLDFSDELERVRAAARDEQRRQQRQKFAQKRAKYLAEVEDKRPPDEQLTPREYLNLVKERVGDSKLFHRFINLIKEYSDRRRDVQEMIDFVVDSFGEDDSDLVMKFSQYLPEGWKISPRYIRQRLAQGIQNREPSPVVTQAHLQQLKEEITDLANERLKDDPIGRERFAAMMEGFGENGDTHALGQEAEYLFAGDVQILQKVNELIRVYPDQHNGTTTNGYEM